MEQNQDDGLSVAASPPGHSPSWLSQSPLSQAEQSVPNAEQLATLCEEMPAANRELDVLIAVATDWRWPDWEEGETTCRGQAEKHGIDWLIGRAVEGMASMWRYIPHFTSSIDAALTLAPDNSLWAWDIDAIACVYLCGESSSQIGQHEQPALALCAAALRARAASAMSAGTAETQSGSGLQPASAVAKPDAQPTGDLG